MGTAAPLPDRRERLLRESADWDGGVPPGTRAGPQRRAVAPALIIPSPFVARCNSPAHDGRWRSLNPRKIAFHRQPGGSAWFLFLERDTRLQTICTGHSKSSFHGWKLVYCSLKCKIGHLFLFLGEEINVFAWRGPGRAERGREAAL